MASAAVSPERHDTVALAWTKAPILDCLAQARQALERFAGDPTELATLALYVDNLHLVHGCLRMLELRGATRLAEELELLGRAMADGQISPRGDCLGAMFRGLEQLPPYLERLRGARHDLPLVMLPLLNRLRECRGVEPLAQGSLMGEAAQRLAGAADLADLDLSLGNWREQLQAGQGRDALRSVVAALCDDLMRIKDCLDQFVRGEQSREQLDALVAPLRQVADTLAVLNFQQPRRVIIDQVLALQALAQDQQSVDDALLMDVAGALLYVEATLNGMVGPLEESGQGSMPGSDMAHIRHVVLSEAVSVLQQAKDLIGDCLESGWPRQRLQALPGLLQQVRGALAMLMLPAAAELFAGAAGYVQGWLAHLDEEPQLDELTHLADALCAGECYLQWRVADPLADAQPFIDMARSSLAALGVNCGHGALADEGEEIDAELREVFLEEANELLPEIERHWLRWRADNSLREALIEVRRALHTLKGSAAMAGVMPIAELATAFDRLAREYRSHELRLQQTELDWLEAAHALFHLGLAQLHSTPLAPIAGAAELIEQVGQGVDAQLAALHDESSANRRSRRDPQLIASFLAESMDILLDAESLLARWQQQPQQRQELETLLDELTNLSHGANLADLWQVDEVCEALLDLYGAVEEGSLVADTRFFNQARQAHDVLIDMLDEIAAGQEVSSRGECVDGLRALLDLALAPDGTGLIGRDGITPLPPLEYAQVVQPALLEAPPEPSQAPATVEPVEPAEAADSPGDQELLEVFLEESSDIVESSAAALARWQADPRSSVEVETLLRDLHTLKGGARMVEIAAIGDLAHELEFLYELLAAGRLPPTAALFALLQNCHDRLAHMLDAVRLGEPLHAATALIDYIRNFS
ncbi:Hpt domain-containing protein, partial [Pseudomonas fluorescens]|uniref:Hpt domain-containing protein n=1 Tax=Pseudomonas fluorescens TaxID=294 RepID=UPI00177F1CBD